MYFLYYSIISSIFKFTIRLYFETGIQGQRQAASFKGEPSSAHVTSPEISDVEVRRSNGPAIDSLAGESGMEIEAGTGRNADLPKWVRPSGASKPQKVAHPSEVYNVVG